MDRSLTDVEINALQDDLRAKAAETLAVELR
jgi:phenylalanyl-tRNA synthetase beta subunit